ncbi:MAG: hypothetical protein FWH03_07795 [Firmicutes bacterium]|nr:hypothetical protein [Bacillota bacterium]
MSKKVFLDQKQTPSDKVFNWVGLSCGIAASAILLLCLTLFFINEDVSAAAWIWTFYPLAVLLAAGTFCSAAQLLRNRYLSSMFAFILNIAAIVAAIVVIIAQFVLHQSVYIAPFIFL